MNYPSISVVVPSYNQGEFIEETLLSIIGQQYPNLELIVMDGGSTDKTVDIIKKYESHISYWHSRQDNGQGDAINKGFEISSGDILCWLNSDDVYLPGTLFKVAQMLGKNDEKKLIYGGCILFSQKGEFTQGRLPPPFDAEKLTYFDYLQQPSCFWTKKLWQQTGKLNESYNYVLDWDWFIRASKQCNFIPVNKYFSLYRLHDQHKTGTGKNVRNQEVIKIVQEYAEEKWVHLYRDVDQEVDNLRTNLKSLNQLRENLYYNLKVNINIYRLRYILHRKLYKNYSDENIEQIALKMLS